MNAKNLTNLGWRGHLRLLLLRVTRDPILTLRVKQAELRLDYVEQHLERSSRTSANGVRDIVAPPYYVGAAGRMQVLEQQLEALQARVDVLTLALADCRAELAAPHQHPKDMS